jgi:biofilm PGA synthesis N-glycosyltransferase PgaC
VQTAPVYKTSDLLRQRIRWGAKSTHYRMADIQIVALLVVVTNFLMLGVPVWMLFQPELCRWLLMGLGMKLLADFIILAATSFRTGQTRTLWWYIPVAVVYPLYMAFVIMGTLLSSPLWKGRPV